MNKVVFSEKLKYLRLKQNMSQSQLAKNLGITRQSLSKYELGIAEPNLYTIIKIADYFKCSLDSLIFDSIELDKSISSVDFDYFKAELLSIENTSKLLETKIKKLKSSMNNLKDNSSYTKYSSNNITELRQLIEENDEIKCRDINLLGNIAAGEPCYALGEVLDTFYIPEDLLSPNKEYYILKVKGDSMNLLFDDQELVLVECTQSLSNLDIGITLVDNEEATIKKVEFNDYFTTLIPMSSNEAHTPKTYKKDAVKFQGRVIGKLINFLKPSPN